MSPILSIFIILAAACVSAPKEDLGEQKIQKNNSKSQGQGVALQASDQTSKSEKTKNTDVSSPDSKTSKLNSAATAVQSDKKINKTSEVKPRESLYTLLVKHIAISAQADRLDSFEFTIPQEDTITALSSLENPAEQDRAILALAILVRSGNAIQLKRNPQTEDEASDVPEENKLGNDVRILESLSSDYDINIGEEMAKNSFLKNPDIYRYAIMVIAESESALEYKKANMAAILTQKKDWELNFQRMENWLKTGNYLAVQIPSEENLQKHNENSKRTDATDDNSKTAPTSISGNKQQDESSSEKAGSVDLGPISLGHAKELALAGNYPNAIAVLSRIPPSDPEYSDAQTLSKTLSNNAVQELRRKAAAAYQNSLPVADKETRKAYLLEAKKHLETALKDYPSADLKSTVQENLNRIMRQLEDFEIKAK